MASFSIGQKVITNDDETGWIKDVRGKEYLVNIRRTGAIKIYHHSELQALAVDPLDKKVTPIKMEFALEQNFKEVIKHIEDGTHRLVSQEMQHDYDKRDKEHVISINLILKENK